MSGFVLMPCRALEAFRHIRFVQDNDFGDLRLNALSGIGGVQTQVLGSATTVAVFSLNALSGIGGVQTYVGVLPMETVSIVLMPCRALEAFRPLLPPCIRCGRVGLNALSGIGGVQTNDLGVVEAQAMMS